MDISAYYSEWLLNRLHEEYYLVRNSWDMHQVYRVNLSPTVVDELILWTKNPIPMLHCLRELEKYNFLFQFTVNAYGKDIEPHVPVKRSDILPAFCRLSRAVGRDRVIWRYEPIFLSERYTVKYHCRYFRKLTEILCEHTRKCVIGFLQPIRKTDWRKRRFGVQEMDPEQQGEILGVFSDTTRRYGLSMEISSKCQSDDGIDIGMSNACPGLCAYCSESCHAEIIRGAVSRHNPECPLLFGEIYEDDMFFEWESRLLNSTRRR